jgi:hypothetical protein
MVEARSKIEARGDVACWINVQTLRNLNAQQAFLVVVQRLCDLSTTAFAGRTRAPASSTLSKEIHARSERLLDSPGRAKTGVAVLIPQVQQFLKLLSAESQKSIYLFVDDFHYLNVSEQPSFLDMIHGASRDTLTWIKAAGIKHQSRWFTDNPPVGLQTKQDASIIDLDITLEDPQKAHHFLTEILTTYTARAKLNTVRAAFSGSSIDRLVIASGGVPRDFLLLGASALQVARERARAKQAGVQDVNEAAGRASKIKLTELEEDAASSGIQAQKTLRVLQSVREFLLDEEKATYLRVGFLEKEKYPEAYSQLQALMDLRLLHLVHASLSDDHQAGRRYEVYAMDLSQFSGSRLKYNLKALDLVDGKLVLRNTGTKVAPKVGNTAKSILAILRAGPVLPLLRLADIISNSQDDALKINKKAASSKGTNAASRSTGA